MYKETAIFIVVLSLVGCATSLKIIAPHKQSFQNYKVGEVQQAYIGDPIIEIEKSSVRDVYVSLLDYQTPTIGIQGSQQIFIKEGDRFTVVAEIPGRSDEALICQEGQEKKDKFIGISQDGFVSRGWVLSNGIIPLQGSWLKGPLFQKSNTPSRSDHSFKSQIIYSGLSEKTLRAVYREFSDDYARPAFSQELQYNLDESKTISYKTLRIEIIKATNSLVEFKVLDDGGLPWFPK